MTEGDNSDISGRRSPVLSFWQPAAALALCLGPVAAGRAQERLTTRQWEAMSATAVNRTVRRDLLSVLAPTGKTTSGMRRSLQGVELSTRPVGTTFKGVCRRDSVVLWYATDEERGEPEDAPVRPYSVSAEPLFHLLELPTIDQATGWPKTSTLDQRACLTLDYGWADPRNAEDQDDDDDDEEERHPAVWISAKDANLAVSGALVMERALEKVKAGTLKPLPCDDNRIGPLLHSCEEAITASGGWREMYSVSTCSVGTDEICYKIDAAHGIELTIVASGDGEDTVPTEILSIAVEQFIIVT